MKTILPVLALTAAVLLSGCETYVVDRHPTTRRYGYTSYEHRSGYYGDHGYYNDRYYPRSSATVIVGSRPSGYGYRSSAYRSSSYAARRTNQVYVQPRSSGYTHTNATVVVTDKKKKKHHHD